MAIGYGNLKFKKEVWPGDVHVEGPGHVMILMAMKKPLQLWPWAHPSPSQNLPEPPFLPGSCPDVLTHEQGHLWYQTVSFLPFQSHATVLLSYNLDSRPAGVGKPEACSLPSSSRTSFKPVPLMSLSSSPIQIVQMPLPCQGPV